MSQMRLPCWDRILQDDIPVPEALSWPPENPRCLGCGHQDPVIETITLRNDQAIMSMLNQTCLLAVSLETDTFQESAEPSLIDHSTPHETRCVECGSDSVRTHARACYDPQTNRLTVEYLDEKSSSCDICHSLNFEADSIRLTSAHEKLSLIAERQHRAGEIRAQIAAAVAWIENNLAHFALDAGFPDTVRDLLERTENGARRAARDA